MKNLKFPVFAMTLGMLLFSFGKSSTVSADELKIGKKAPKTDVVMENVDKSTHTLDKLKQENGLLVVFSCNTCPFVVGNENFPGWERQYNTIYQKASEAKIGMVLINSNEGKRTDEDSFEAMQKHAADKGYKMPYLLDKNSDLANAFGAKTTPHVYLLDKDMKLIYQGSIDNTWDPKRKSDIPYLSDALSNVSAGKNVQENTTSPKGCSIKRVAIQK